MQRDTPEGETEGSYGSIEKQQNTGIKCAESIKMPLKISLKGCVFKKTFMDPMTQSRVVFVRLVKV